MQNNNQDKAGQDYWNETWDISALPKPWDIESGDLAKYTERSFFNYLKSTFEENHLLNTKAQLVEVGCARSQVLPVMASKLGFQISGIDYSPNGCEQTRQMLDLEGIDNDIHCCDIFSIPDELIGKYDVVISFGLIEHFSETSGVVTALAGLLKPGGLIFTNVPNMNGVTGFAQKWFNRPIYDIHVALNAEDVKRAHEAASLEVLTCDYFLPNNFGVVNLGPNKKGSILWWGKKISLAILARISMVVWWLEIKFKKLPVSHSFSPYINCVAQKNDNG